MGNKASYNQVPADMNSPSLHATDLSSKSVDKASKLQESNTVGSDLMFVFHDTEDDSAERVVHEQIENQRNIEEELKFSITLNEKCICERLNYAEATDIHSLCSIMQPGDLVEFCAESHAHHWVVYLGNGRCIQLKNGIVSEEIITTIHPDRMARIVSSVYKFKPSPPLQICEIARSQIGRDSVWSSSECFSAWCRYSRPEFLSDKIEIKDLDSVKADTSTEKCRIDIHNNAGMITQTKHFTNLVELIKYRRKREKGDEKY